MTFKHFPFVLAFAAMVAAGGCATEKTAGNAVAQKATATKLRFADATKSSGVVFTHVATRTEEKFMPEVLGAGAAVADFNRDGAPDLVLVNSGAIGAAARPENARTRLFINDGKGVFADKTDEWQLASHGYGFGAAVGDFDNDGLTDLFLTSYEGDNRLWRNAGGRFEDVTAASGIKPDGKWATSAGFGDFDGDGRLDLFIVRYVNYTRATAQKTYHNRLPIYTPPYLYEAVADQLWRNDGGGKFSDASRTSGLDASAQKGLAVGIGDIDLDGDADAYVANDTTPNQLWINDGKAKFKDVARLSGSAYSEGGKEEGSMGADFSDVDGNRLPDIVVPNFQTETTALYSQEAPLLFREVSDAVGIGEAARARLKFGCDFFDADNDGDEDLMVANGHIEDNIEQNSSSETFAQQNTLYENLGGGKFRDVSDAAGDALADKQVSRGLVTADFNGDGALDFLVTNNGGTAQLAFNQTIERGNFAVFWLEGAPANRSAIGARLVARVGDRQIERQIMGAQSYLSVSDFRVHFGLGAADRIDELTVHWPGGQTQTLRDVAAGKFYHLKQGGELQPFVPGERAIPDSKLQIPN